MGLVEEVLAEAKTIRPCALGAWTTSSDAVEAAEVEELGELHLARKVSVGAVRRALEKHGCALAESTVRKHLIRDCGCYAS